MQLMIDDEQGGEWIYRRDARVRRPVVDLDGPASNSDRRVLAPEIQLLYKSARPREKDEADFQAALEVLDGARRGWLRDSLSVVAPLHQWLAHL